MPRDWLEVRKQGTHLHRYISVYRNTRRLPGPAAISDSDGAISASADGASACVLDLQSNAARLVR